LFTINSTTGALAFIAAPDFETPKDSGPNNIYDVTVAVSDGNGGIDTQAIAIAIQNIAGLTITGTSHAEILTGSGEEDVIHGLRATTSSEAWPATTISMAARGKTR